MKEKVKKLLSYSSKSYVKYIIIFHLQKVRGIPLSFLECIRSDAAGVPQEDWPQECFSKNSRFELSESSLCCILAYLRGVLDSQDPLTGDVEAALGQATVNIAEDRKDVNKVMQFLNKALY